MNREQRNKTFAKPTSKDMQGNWKHPNPDSVNSMGGTPTGTPFLKQPSVTEQISETVEGVADKVRETSQQIVDKTEELEHKVVDSVKSGLSTARENLSHLLPWSHNSNDAPLKMDVPSVPKPYPRQESFHTNHNLMKQYQDSTHIVRNDCCGDVSPPLKSKL